MLEVEDRKTMTLFLTVLLNRDPSAPETKRLPPYLGLRSIVIYCVVVCLTFASLRANSSALAADDLFPRSNRVLCLKHTFRVDHCDSSAADFCAMYR